MLELSFLTVTPIYFQIQIWLEIAVLDQCQMQDIPY